MTNPTQKLRQIPRQSNFIGLIGFILSFAVILFWPLFTIFVWPYDEPPVEILLAVSILWLLGLVLSIIGLCKTPRGWAVSGLIIAILPVFSAAIGIVKTQNEQSQQLRDWEPDKGTNQSGVLLNQTIPLKGRTFQELVDITHELNDILFDWKLSPEQRAEQLLSRGAPMAYADLLEMVKAVDYCDQQQCDGPCFAARQDSIICSATDETLDIYWYYEVRGGDSVLMFDMERYNDWIAYSSKIQARIDEWNRRAEMETENTERIYSLDMKYAAYISIHPNPIFQNEVIADETEGWPIYRNGIGLTDRQSGTSRQLIAPGQDPIRENICNLIWSLESDIIYFTSYGDTADSAGVYGCNIFSGKISLLSDGNLVELILDEPYIGWLKILNSCFVEGEGGRHWYYAALSPDGKTEIRLTEPSLDMPEN